MKAQGIFVLAVAIHGFVLLPVAQGWAQWAGNQALVETTAQDLIEKGIARYELEEYEDALSALEDALIMPDISKDQKLEAYKYRGASLVKLGREEEALAEFAKAREIGKNAILEAPVFDAQVRGVWDKTGEGKWWTGMHKKWWFWGGVAVVVGGCVACAIGCGGGGGGGGDTGSLTIDFDFEG